MQPGAIQTLEERVEAALRPGVLTHQGLSLLIRAAFVAGEYIPLPFLVELDENAPLHVRIALRNDLKTLDERVKLATFRPRTETELVIPPAVTMGVYRQIMVGVNAGVADYLIGKCMAKRQFGRPHILYLICSSASNVVLTKLMDGYLRFVPRYGTIPLEHMPYFESLITKCGHMHWKHMMSPIAIYGAVPNDHFACRTLTRALITLSYTHICSKNWELGKRHVQRAKYVARNTALQAPEPVTGDWDYDMTVYKQTFLAPELDWITCLTRYASCHEQNPRERIERDLEECCRKREYWETRRKYGVEAAEEVNERWAQASDEIGIEPWGQINNETNPVGQ